MNQVGQVVSQNIKHRLMVGCISLIIGVPVSVCCLLVLFTVVLPQMESLSMNGQQGNIPLILLIAGGFVLSGLIILPVVVMFFVIRKRATMLDTVFFPLGFQGKMYLLVGRHYWGRFGDREVEIYIYRGPTMEIRISAQSRTRIQIIRKGTIPVKISGILQKNPLVLTNPQLSSYAVYADDEAWAQQFLSDTSIFPALESLMIDHVDWAVFRHLEIQPGQVTLFLHRSKNMYLNSGQFSAVQPWLIALSTLAARIESLAQPERNSQPVRGFSRAERLKRSQIQFVVILGILIGMPLCMVTLGILTYLLVS